MKELLRESMLFGRCTPEQLAAVAARCRRRTYAAGSMIIEANTSADRFYVVEEGSIDLHFTLTCYGATQEVTVDRKLRGDVFGWSSLLASRTFTLSATATRESTLLEIHSAEIDELFANHHFGHVVMRALAEIIGQRFNVMQQMLIDMLQDRVVR
jgi:CRP-like cAMP-binding protein